MSILSTPGLQHFQHERLRLSENSIRLVRVHGGAKTDILSLRITQYSIQKRPPYAAISYTWGSASNLKEVKVNGRVFRIHANLWHLLYHLRQRGESRFLWVDALCIDQANLAERNFHVQLMGKIYDQAEFAIVWLGIPADDRREARAIDFITEMATYQQSKSGASFRDMFLTEKAKSRWTNLVGFCRCKYWTRTWIIQEFLQARQIEVLCGIARLEWYLYDILFVKLRDLINRPDYLIQELADFMSSVPSRLTARRMSQQGSVLQELIHEFYDAECTEPRDKVYGMLGIAGDCGEDPETGYFRGPQPDYSKHIMEVYFDVVSYLRDANPHAYVSPLTILLLQESLCLSKETIIDYFSTITSHQLATTITDTTIELKPDYISVIQDTIPNWTSVRDLRQRLEQFDWAKYVGYEVQRKTSRPSTSQSTSHSRIPSFTSSTRSVRGPLPTDLIPNAVEVAENASELLTLYNYQYSYTPSSSTLPMDLSSSHHNINSSGGGFHLPTSIHSMHPADKRSLDNPSYHKATLIIESSTAANPVRLGFACTNTRKGDFLIQFSGMDIALVGRLTPQATGRRLELVGKAVMVGHEQIKEATVVDVHKVCRSGKGRESRFVVGCLDAFNKGDGDVEHLSKDLAGLGFGPGAGVGTRGAGGLGEDDLCLQTDPLSLLELLRRDWLV